VYTGRSAAIFRESKYDRLLFPKAVVQMKPNSQIWTAAFGHNRTFARQEEPDMKPGYSSSEGQLLYGVYQIGEV
jgi:hypothetical protein